MSTVSKTNRYYWGALATGPAIGIVYLIGFLLGGKPRDGVIALAIMVGLTGAMLLVARHSETVRGLIDRRDERIASIDLRATAVTALAMIVAVLVGFVVNVARGGTGWPYSVIGAIGGVAYVAAVVLFRVTG
jgi:hypothetical protein